MVMTANRSRSVTFRDIARILFRHRRKMVLFFCGVVGLTLLAIAFYPRSYASEAKLLIRVGRESVALDPTATTGETITLQKTQEDEVNSALSILGSREILDRVVERVGAARIIEDVRPVAPLATDFGSTIADARAWLNNALQTLRLSDPGTEVDRAIRRLEQRYRVTAPKQSMVITVKYTAASPQLAHDVVAAITDAFLEQHSRLNQTEGSLEFFAEQAEKLHTELTAAQAQLRDRKNAYQRTSSDSRLSILENARDAMREKIYDLQLQESELRSRYTEEYPLLREIERQRQEAERLLTDTPGGAIRPVAYTTARGDETSVQPVQASARSGRALSKLQSELQTINDQEFELAQLAREVELLEGKYKMHVEKLEQARVNDELGRERITNVKVAQPATLVYKPVAPMKAVMLSLGTMVALCGGLGLAFVAESCDQTLRTTDQVEAQLGLPVLASLPRRKRRWWRRAKRTTGSSLVCAMSADSPTEQTNVVPRTSDGALVKALRATTANGHPHAKTVGVVGCETTNLRSRVATVLAMQAATSGRDSVLLIDADTRHKRVSRRFRLNGAPGWREISAGSVAAKCCIKPSTLSNLAVLGPGHAPDGGSARSSLESALAQLGDVKADYELIVVDLPLARKFDVPPNANWIDEVVLVVEAERTRIQAAQRARDTLQRAGIRVAGVVLANRREHIPGWLYRRL
jgi:uncharacterized protein involved in exopolysaccharide biosynthesis/Mrp family chromosome partitioning ATPase